MASTHQSITLGTASATQITNIVSSSKRNGVVLVLNSDKTNTSTIFIGGDNTVTTTNFGYHMDKDQTLILHGYFDYTDDLWAITDSGTPKLHVLTMGL